MRALGRLLGIWKATRPSCAAAAMPLHPERVRVSLQPTLQPHAHQGSARGQGEFDGYRVQVHKAGQRVVIFSHNGHEFSERFPSILRELRELPANAAVLDGEVVANDADGLPNFARLHVRWTRPGALHLWAFDLLALNGQDWRPQPLVKRQHRLQVLLARFGCPAVSPSRRDRQQAPRRPPTGQVIPGTGGRSRRLPGLKRTGSDGACLSAARRKVRARRQSDRDAEPCATV